MHVYACLCMSMPVYACLCLYLHVYVCICMYMYVHVRVCMCMYVYVCVCMCMYVYVCVCMYMHKSRFLLATCILTTLPRQLSHSICNACLEPLKTLHPSRVPGLYIFIYLVVVNLKNMYVYINTYNYVSNLILYIIYLYVIYTVYFICIYIYIYILFDIYI